MFEKLIRLIKEALDKLKNTADGDAEVVQMYSVANKMQAAIDKWAQMYADEAPWLDEHGEGTFSYGIPASICEELARYVLTELDTHIVVAGQIEDDKAHDDSADRPIENRAEWLDNIYHKRLLKNIRENLEKAMAYGGMIVKPYISNNSIHYDICYQGEFVPIAFDDDGHIIDIAFMDSYIEGSYKYSKVERHKFDAMQRTIIVTNRAYKSKIHSASNDITELGLEIPLDRISKWSGIESEITITNIDRPLYGYYRVPIANNIDIKCPLGVSVFHKASKIIQKADVQVGRLDWEYDAGSMAIDVDPTAIQGQKGYYNTLEIDKGRNKVYRKIDLGSDETYHEFAPSLRDANYINGLNMYLMRIEDICGVARGTISNVDSVAKTATEIVSSKQKTIVTTRAHQDALQSCFEDVIYATNALAEFYKDELDAKDGDYILNCEWSDSAIVDTYTELEQKLNLMREKILSKAEVRAWYLGEDEETAQANIDQIESSSSNALMGDIFTQPLETTLEQA